MYMRQLKHFSLRQQLRLSASVRAAAVCLSLSATFSITASYVSSCLAQEPVTSVPAPVLPPSPAKPSADTTELKPLPIPDTIPATLPERFSCIVRARKTMADGTNVKLDTKYYVDKGNFRSESGYPNSETIFFINAKTSLGYLLNPSAKTYFQGPINPGVMTFAMLLPPSRPKWELTGREKIKDVECEILTYVNVGKDATPTAVRFWRARETWFPMRLVDESSDSMIEWLEYKIEPQDASLFTPPPGFTLDKGARPK
jgi:hypothetical protein